MSAVKINNFKRRSADIAVQDLTIDKDRGRLEIGPSAQINDAARFAETGRRLEYGSRVEPTRRREYPLASNRKLSQGLVNIYHLK